MSIPLNLMQLFNITEKIWAKKNGMQQVRFMCEKRRREGQTLRHERFGVSTCSFLLLR